MQPLQGLQPKNVSFSSFSNHFNGNLKSVKYSNISVLSDLLMLDDYSFGQYQMYQFLY